MKFKFKYHYTIFAVLYIFNNINAINAINGEIKIDDFTNSNLNNLKESTLLNTGFQRNIFKFNNLNPSPDYERVDANDLTISNFYGSNRLECEFKQRGDSLGIIYQSSSPINLQDNRYLNFMLYNQSNTAINYPHVNANLYFIFNDPISNNPILNVLSNCSIYTQPKITIYNVYASLNNKEYRKYLSSCYGIALIISAEVPDQKICMQGIHLLNASRYSEWSTHLELSDIQYTYPSTQEPSIETNKVLLSHIRSQNTNFSPASSASPVSPTLTTPPSRTAPTHGNQARFAPHSIEPTQAIELEEEAQNPVPEPFSILTMGTGITAFIRHKRKKNN